MRGQPPAPAEVGQLDHHRHRDDDPAEGLDELDAGGQRAAGGQDVVDDEHPLARPQRVGVQLEGGRSVLEGVVGRDRGPGQLAGLAHRDDADAGPDRHGRGEQEAARLHADHDVEARPTVPRDRRGARVAVLRSGQSLDHATEADRVGEDRRQVAEEHPGRREVGDVDGETGEELVERLRRRSLGHRRLVEPVRRLPGRCGR